VLDTGRVSMDVAIDLPRPRRRGDPAAAAIEGQILERLLERDGS
jgi:sulfonate transport system ATP-binding protein